MAFLSAPAFGKKLEHSEQSHAPDLLSTYGHLARDSELQIRARLEARSAGMGLERAPGDGE